MKRTQLSPPDPYTRMPLVALLPIQGEIGRLEAYTSSLYARLEKVKAVQGEQGGGEGALRRSNPELAMLSQVLDWLSVVAPERIGAPATKTSLKSPPTKTSSFPEVQKRGYAEEEIAHLYELARFSLENGEFRRAEIILGGITDIAPEYAPAWLAWCALHHHNKEYDAAVAAATHAVKVSPDSIEAMLYLAGALLSTGDISSAGSYLGEVGEKVEAGMVDNPPLLKFYRAQLARYQSR